MNTIPDPAHPPLAAGTHSTAGVTGPRLGPLLIAFAIGTALSVGLGVYGRVHSPTGQAINIAGFSSGVEAKAALTSLAFALAILQTITALSMYGRLRLEGSWVAPTHRWSGRLAVLVTVPVAVHCLYALGFQTFDTRIVLHSLLGCFFYGVFVCKMLVLSRDDSPTWAIPVLGGVVMSALTALWLTSSLWFYLTF